MQNLKIGDKVRYFCNSALIHKIGTVTAVDVPVLWAKEPTLGVRIDNDLVLAYAHNDKSKVWN